MDETTPQAADANTPKAPKDKNCPYCGQAFTSSSLGRHLDLYIKEKNPKPADGVHDVDAIRKLRGNITRRQARGSMGGRRESSRTPASTPRPSISKGTPSQDGEGPQSSIPKDGQYAVDAAGVNKFPFAPRWEATGVMNDIPSKNAWEGESSQDTPAKRPPPQRNISKQLMQKTQFDAKQKLADAMDTARAAELALREFIGSWRSAKQHIDNSSSPFDFDPLSLDFPALTLQCLKPPPTLFSSTQHPTSTSWSVQCPGKREYDALVAYFEKELRAWKLTCATATTAVAEELVYPPNSMPYHDVREAVKLAEESTSHLEKNINEHLQSAYAAWEVLPQARKSEVWLLELARAVGSKQKETDALQSERHLLKQENNNLRAQIDQLNRLQQPREFKLLSPQTFPIDRNLVVEAFERGVHANKTVGFDVEDRHMDLGSLVTKVIGRWKNVITTTRLSSQGMNSQKPLDQTTNPPMTPNTGDSPQKNTPFLKKASSSMSQSTQQQSAQSDQMRTQSQQSQPDGPNSTTSGNEEASEPTVTTSASGTGPPSVADTSDQDADAEMEDDDSFALMNTSSMKSTTVDMQPQEPLEVPRTRGQLQQRQQQQQQQRQQHQHHQQQQQQLQAASMHYMMQNGEGSPIARQGVAMTRSMPNMNMAMQGNAMQDMGMSMQEVQGDTMYME